MPDCLSCLSCLQCLHIQCIWGSACTPIRGSRGSAQHWDLTPHTMWISCRFSALCTRSIKMNAQNDLCKIRTHLCEYMCNCRYVYIYTYIHIYIYTYIYIDIDIYIYICMFNDLCTMTNYRCILGMSRGKVWPNRIFSASLSSVDRASCTSSSAFSAAVSACSTYNKTYRIWITFGIIFLLSFPI